MKNNLAGRFSISSGKNKPVVMEVIGKKGIKVAEYVDNGDDSLPYQLVEESYAL